MAHPDARTAIKALARHPADAYRAAKLDLRAGRMTATDAEAAAFKRDVVPYWTSPELKAMIRKLLGG